MRRASFQYDLQRRWFIARAAYRQPILVVTAMGALGWDRIQKAHPASRRTSGLMRVG